MSGVEISKVPRERDPHVCASCMNAVTQMFSYFQGQIKTLRSEKANLQEEVKRLKTLGAEQIQIMAGEIRALEKEVAMLKKDSESLKESASNVV
jgi:SMC interacting uncharacterized protein involved in chromosome segregation